MKDGKAALPSPSGEAIARETAEAVRQALERLPEKMLVVVKHPVKGEWK